MKGSGCDCTTMGWVMLVVGILYLLSDLGAVSWWNFSWYTVLFILMGIKWAFGNK
jgi:hypothetical protein